MKIVLTENKFLNVIQKVIDYNLNYLKKLKEENEYSGPPDDISDSTWDDIQTVEKIIVTNHRMTEFTILKTQIHVVSLDVIYDSVAGINVPDILYDIQELCVKTLGSRVHFTLGEEINKYRDYGQW